MGRAVRKNDRERPGRKHTPDDSSADWGAGRITELEAAKNDVIASGNAQAVFRRLCEIEQSRGANLSRWAWELLQNARDAAGKDLTVSVKVAFDGTTLKFCHDGPPFRNEEIAHLIFHGSTKQEHLGIGRFGTGFISTHLLSRVVRVKGPLEDGTAFDFDLDRTGHDAKTLQASMERSWSAMKESIRQRRHDDDDQTTFAYTIGDDTRPYVIEGINELRRAAPLILAFNPQFSSLSVEVDGDCVTYHIRDRRCQATDLHEMCVANGSGSDVARVIVAEAEDVRVAIAVMLTLPSDSILPEAGMSRVYVAFPLLKTDTFPLRAAMNSEGFHPRTERDGIYLLSEDSEQNCQNRARFELGCDAFSRLVEYAVHSPIASLPELLVLSEPSNLENVDAEWLKQTIAIRVVGELRARNVFRTCEGSLVELQSAVIPLANADKRHALSSLIARIKAHATLLPKAEELDAWNDVVASWMEFTALEAGDFNEAWTLERLVRWTADAGTTATLTELIEGDVWEWLSDVYDVLQENELLDLVDEHAIVPNQSGDFLKACSLLRDPGIPDDLKDLAEDAGLEARNRLLVPELSDCCLASRLAEETADEFIRATIDQIGTVDEGEWQIAVRLLAFVVKNRLDDWLDTIPVVTATDPPETTTFSLDAPPTQRLLVPAARWGGATTFGTLFPAGVVMRDAYATLLAEEDWAWLIDRGAAIASPLVSESELVDDFIDAADTDSEQDEQPRSKDRIARSHVAHFPSVLERVRDSRHRGALLVSFILDFVVPNDAGAFNPRKIECEDGKRRTCYGGAWITPLRSHAWIMKPDKRRVRLTARSLAELLSDQPKLVRLLLDDKCAAFLRGLEVIPSELALQTFGKTDTDRMSLIRSLGVIADAVGNDPARIARFANTVRSDKTLLQYIEQRSAFIERIERNQSFGFAIEREFNAVFQDEKGVQITRTGRGHDFAVSAVAGEEDDAGTLEVRREMQQIFIELKATREADAVHMSVRQVEAAMQMHDRYWLCVVVGDDEDTTSDVVRASAKFVCDIGSRLQDAWAAYEDLRDATPASADLLRETALEVSGQEVRFRVGHRLWGSGISFEQAMKRLRMQVRPAKGKKRR